MIKQSTAALIWECYREIQAAEQLLADITKSQEEFSSDVRAGTLKDAFGRQQKLQLGIPSGDNCHRLFSVDPKVAVVVIMQHIADCRSRLKAANNLASTEITDE